MNQIPNIEEWENVEIVRDATSRVLDVITDCFTHKARIVKFVRQDIDTIITDTINKAISSRDTYWKEKVQEERLRARQEVQIKQQNGQLGFEVIVATLVNTPVESERIKSKMAQALKEAIVGHTIR